MLRFCKMEAWRAPKNLGTCTQLPPDIQRIYTSLQGHQMLSSHYRELLIAHSSKVRVFVPRNLVAGLEH